MRRWPALSRLSLRPWNTQQSAAVCRGHRSQTRRCWSSCRATGVKAQRSPRPSSRKLPRPPGQPPKWFVYWSGWGTGSSATAPGTTSAIEKTLSGRSACRGIVETSRQVQSAPSRGRRGSVPTMPSDSSEPKSGLSCRRGDAERGRDVHGLAGRRHGYARGRLPSRRAVRTTPPAGGRSGRSQAAARDGHGRVSQGRAGGAAADQSSCPASRPWRAANLPERRRQPQLMINEPGEGFVQVVFDRASQCGPSRALAPRMGSPEPRPNVGWVSVVDFDWQEYVPTVREHRLPHQNPSSSSRSVSLPFYEPLGLLPGAVPSCRAVTWELHVLQAG